MPARSHCDLNLDMAPQIYNPRPCCIYIINWFFSVIAIIVPLSSPLSSSSTSVGNVAEVFFASSCSLYYRGLCGSCSNCLLTNGPIEHVLRLGLVVHFSPLQVTYGSQKLPLMAKPNILTEAGPKIGTILHSPKRPYFGSQIVSSFHRLYLVCARKTCSRL